MRQSAMEKCPLMKNMCLSPSFREFIAERSPMNVKGLWRTVMWLPIYCTSEISNWWKNFWMWEDGKAYICASHIVQHEHIYTNEKPNTCRELIKVCTQNGGGGQAQNVLLRSSQTLALNSWQITQDTKTCILRWH